MDEVILKVKRLENNPDLPLPAYESDGSSGLDLRAAVTGDITLHPGDIELIPTGISISIPKGYEAQIRPRSGMALKYGMGLVNSPGTVDADYRGEVRLITINWGKELITIRRGDRIAQMVITRISRALVQEVVQLEGTERGEGGFGHTGI